MKSDYVQPQKTKERLKGLRASDFMRGRRFKDVLEGSESWGFQDTWALKDFGSQVDESPAPVFQSHKDILNYCVAVLAASPTARAMLREAEAEGWSVGIADLGSHDFHLDVPEKQIILNDNGLMVNALGRSDYFMNVMKISFIRALRDVWQEKRHGGFDEHYGPESILMLERVRAADCDVMATMVSWELRGEGYADLWRHMMGSDEGDIAMAYVTRLEKDPSSQFSGAALAAAFHQWYRDIHRINTCDHETLEYLDDVIRSAGTGETIFGDKKLTRVAIEVLSCLPDKTAYLRGLGHEILTGPAYAGLQDEVNQIHFMQIIYDMKVTMVQGVPFRDSALAEKIFPGGLLTREDDIVHETR